jgi:Ca2+-transporting ATPase
MWVAGGRSAGDHPDLGELAQLSDEEVKQKLPHLYVVARAFPTDKSRLVKLAKELGLVVGMTGDGVNDARR